MDTPTIYDVSRLSGVSTATVSRTFTTPDRVRESTRRRVYAAAEALHYQPSAIARAMARQQTDKIAFLICKEGATILDEFYASICEGVMRRANGTNYQLLISTAEEWTRTAQSKQIEGVILAGNAQADLISEFQRQNIPDRPSAVFAFNDVLAAGVMKAARRLGLRLPEDLAVVGFDDSSVCPMMEPELSSIHVDCRRMGELCMEHMAALLDGAQDIPRLTVVPVNLKIRASSRAAI